MSSVKISQLTASSGLSSADLIPVVDNSDSQTQKATFQQVLNYITGSTFNTLTVTSLTASNAVATGSFSGSFVGNGSGLTNLTIPSGSFTLGSTSITLGTTTTTVQGLSVITGSTVTGSTALFTTVNASGANISGDLFVSGVLTATEYHTTVISASIIYQSGSTKFGDDSADTHQFSGSILLSGTLTANNTISGTTAQFTTVSASTISASNYVGIPVTSPGGSDTAIQFNSGSTFSGSTNLVYDYVNGILSGTTAQFAVITGSTVTGSTALFTTVSASKAEISGNLVIYGSASLAEYPDYAYVLYTASYDKIVVYPGLYVSGNLTGSGHASFQAVSGTTAQFTTISGSGAGITGLTASNFSSFSADVRNQLSATGSVSYNPSTGVISSSALTAAVTQINAGSNIGITSGSGPTATIALSASVSGLTNLSSSAITGSNMLASNSFKAAGSFTVAQITTAGSYVVVDTDNIIFANASSAPLTVTLPTIAVGNAGRQLIVKKIDTSVNTVTISGSVDGALFYQLNGPYQSVTLVSDGSTYWFVL